MAKLGWTKGALMILLCTNPPKVFLFSLHNAQVAKGWSTIACEWFSVSGEGGDYGDKLTVSFSKQLLHWLCT